ncbi:MAG: glutamine--fructose-6-phosphate transaminase (isomerizing) [Clostridia bacterium]|nr:glutamine--fructose-6-phosphate transaminase (isomerizing) [Clostridia bacterium]MDD4386817.1 glutamine--fructose-6-phosphate transaminase (isomerizing) [Clostridia bacterium]
MCGIIGYAGTKRVDKVLISGLKKLEYRGYDSAGLAFITNDNNLEIIKSVGKISKLEEKVNKSNIQFGNVGIGHTRWATHGIPNEINAHPHTSGKVSIVHNGIIENYTNIKEELQSKGVTFYSDTDTEVACAYINYIYETEKDKIKCIQKACKHFRGSYAFGIIFEDDKDSIFVTRRDSPLIIGISDGENFVSSDVSAFLSYTKKYILLDHNEFAKVSSNSVLIYNDNGDLLNKEINIATWSDTQYEKNGYEHFMLKEIYEEPLVLKNIFNRYLNDISYLKDVDLSIYNNIHIVACGSAMHAGLVGRYLFETYANIPVTVDVASEYRYKNQIITDQTLVIIVSQSGETADTLAALRVAKSKGATVLAIVNVLGSTITREANIVIYTYAGPEIAVATTKGYTSQVAILATLAFEISRKHLTLDEKNKIISEMNNIQNILNYVLLKIEEYKDIAKSIYKKEHLFFIGRGIDYSMCMEGSLKLKEISYMHSEAYPAGELKHGTISLIENKTPIIAIATNKNLYEKTISNIKETKARGAFVIFITNEELDTTGDFYDIKLVLPTSTDFLQSLSVVTALQLISYYTAKERKCDIDKPKNLAKSVTVE